MTRLVSRTQRDTTAGLGDWWLTSASFPTAWIADRARQRTRGMDFADQYDDQPNSDLYRALIRTG